MEPVQPHYLPIDPSPPFSYFSLLPLFPAPPPFPLLSSLFPSLSSSPQSCSFNPLQLFLPIPGLEQVDLQVSICLFPLYWVCLVGLQEGLAGWRAVCG